LVDAIVSLRFLFFFFRDVFQWMDG